MTDLQRMTLGGPAKLAQRLSSNDSVVEIAESERARNAQASARGDSPAANRCRKPDQLQLKPGSHCPA
jgi:hypothetical protein